MIALCAVVVLIVGSCGAQADVDSTGEVDPEPTSAVAEDPATPSSDSSAPAPDVDCDALWDAAATLRAAAPQLFVAEDAEFFNTFVGDIGELQAAIAAFRPVQDIDTVLGPVREGLDNFDRDLIAGSEGRFDDIGAGSYSTGAMSALVNALCG